jgi:hypothetical protein
VSRGPSWLPGHPSPVRARINGGVIAEVAEFSEDAEKIPLPPASEPSTFLRVLRELRDLSDYRSNAIGTDL